MGVRASDVVPISEARARLTALAEGVVGQGTEKQQPGYKSKGANV